MKRDLWRKSLFVRRINKIVPTSETQKAYNFIEEEKAIDQACIFPPLETIKEFSKALEKHYNKEKVNIIETLQK